MKQPDAILLVDDEADFRGNVAEHLAAQGFQVLQAGEGEEALALVRSNAVNVAFVDILMPGMDGIALLHRLKQIDPVLEVVIVTGQGSIESAVEAMRGGAFHYVTKPVRLREIEAVARNAIEKAALARQNDLYREDLRRRRRQASAEIIIESPAMRSLFEQAMQIAQVDASVLIEGETGVGKEVVAWFIHSHSPRRDRVFATLNCGALPDTLIDSELFGFEEGAFTGAGEPRPGILEVSDGGSLLLDEVGDLSSAGQIRLLRFLERGLVRRLGRTREQVVDVRVLAATHRDLGAMVDRNEFRQDLFHRLVVLRMAIPPLRERPEDVLPLARHFAVLLTAAGATPPAFTHTAEQALLAYAWPGNVRELRNAVERACLSARIAAEDAIGPERLALPASPGGGGALLSLGEAQRRHVLDVLKSVGGNRQGAAEVLGVTERHLYRLLRQARGSAGAG